MRSSALLGLLASAVMLLLGCGSAPRPVPEYPPIELGVDAGLRADGGQP